MWSRHLRAHGGTEVLVHHSAWSQCVGMVYATRVGEFGMLSSTVMVGDSYDNIIVESSDGGYMTKLF